jgi:ComF family protein
VDGDVLTRLHAGVRTGAGQLLDLVLPRVCALCDRLLRAEEDDLVCGACWLAAEEVPRPRCARCGHSRGIARAPAWRGAGSVEPACTWCELLPPYVRAARSAFAMPGGTAHAIVHALKYGGWSAVARGMARRMAALRFPDDVERERAGLVPVPLSSTRLRERGYNQSMELARWLGALWGIPVLDTLLERTRSTTSQTRLTPGERHRNVAGAFHARAERASLRGRHLVLVDDVVTTAATLNACAAALHDGGARILSFVTFGRAPAVGDRW